MQFQDRISQHAGHVKRRLRQSGTKSSEKYSFRFRASNDQTADHEITTGLNGTAGRDVDQLALRLARPNAKSFASIGKSKAEGDLPQIVQPAVLRLVGPT